MAVMQDAPWAPIFNEQRYTIRFERLGSGDTIFVDLVHVPVNRSNVYAASAS